MTKDKHLKLTNVPVRYALYRRVSHKDSFEKDLSLPQQASQQREYVSRAGGVIVAEYEESEWITASRDDRPQFQKLITAAKAREFDVLLIQKSDRVFRSRLHAVTYKHLLAQHGIRLASVTESFVGSDDPTDRLLEGIIECFNEWYLDNLKAEIHKGLQESAVRGRQNGAVPYGYIYCREGALRWDVDPETSPWVTHVFDAFIARHMSYVDIARELNALGAPSPANPKRSTETQNWQRTSSEWWQFAVKRILTRRQYTGEIHYRGEWFAGTHAPLVSKQVFDTAQSLITSRGTSRSDGQSLFGSGILRCPHCGSSMLITSREYKQGAQRIYYACSKHRRGYIRKTQGMAPTDTCLGFAVSELRIAQQFRETLEALSSAVDPSTLASIDRTPIRTADDSAAIAAALQSERAQIPSIRANYIRLAGKGLVTDEDLSIELVTLVAREQAIDAEMSRIQPLVRAAFEPTDAFWLLRQFDRDDLTKVEKREKIRAVCLSIVPTIDKTGLIINV